MVMSAEHYGRPIASHGCQCGIRTIACAIAWRKWLSDFQLETVDVDSCFPSTEQMQQREQATFDPIEPSGAIAGECWNTYSRKLEGWHRALPRFEAFLINLPQQRNRLVELVHPPVALRGTGHPRAAGSLGLQERSHDVPALQFGGPAQLYGLARRRPRR
jgi:hypothetical protein